MGLRQRWYGIVSGGYTLNINVPINGNTANISLIPTSTYGVVSFGGRLYKVYVAVSSLCIYCTS